MTASSGRRTRASCLSMVLAAIVGLVLVSQLLAQTAFITPVWRPTELSGASLHEASSTGFGQPSVLASSSSSVFQVACFAVMATVAAASIRVRFQHKTRFAMRATAVNTDIDTECVNSIRFLAVDAVNKANSGHPGAPMGQAPIGYVLFGNEMKFNPQNPDWVDRDRFVLSSGHGCMLQYTCLHLAGYSDVTMDDLKAFRQWGSKAPGHPENFETKGIEVTTGPLGMGISNAVGLAAAEAHQAAVYNKPGMTLIDHYTYCILGDGCMQEGISHESCSYAGHLKLGKLIAFWDDNSITIDGHTELSFTEDVNKRFEAYGWEVLTVSDGNNDIAAIKEAIETAKKSTDKPTLVRVKTIIGFGSPNKADSHDAHGAPLGAEEAAATRENLGWKYGEFEIPPSVYDVFKAHASKGAAAEEDWKKTWAEYQEKEPELAKQFKRSVLDKELPEGWVEALPTATPDVKGKATRLHSQDCLNALAPIMPELIGGSADLAPSNMTLMKCTGDFLPGTFAERNMRFGIREFGMGAIANAMSLDKTGLVPYCATFTIFTDYMRNAIRIAALAQAGTIFVTTHDSVALGEDGPTHQPIETVPSLRMIPDLTVMRPADCNETSGAYRVAVERSKNDSRPTLLALSRQALPNLENSSIDNTMKGAYSAVTCDDPELILIGTGSEVSLCLDAAKEMSSTKIRVVSMPSWELFRAQPASYKDALLPKKVPKLSVEAACTFGWGEWSDAHVGINVFGASAPGGTCMDKFGFNVANVVSCAEKCLKGETGVLSDGSQARP